VAEHKSSVAGGIDPLADFIRRGKPAGAWSLPVLRADDPDQGIQPAGHLRVALHAHFYYPELAADFLAHLKPNRCRCDLLVTTDNSTKAEQLHQLLAPYGGGSIEIRIVPNRGRDIGPLLTGFSNHLANYDVIGHVHSKRSLVLDDPTSGETWRQFLWQNLLGGKCRMMDRIIAAFEQDDHLGLVFPSDPHPMDWSDNRVPAANLAARMGWTGPLPDHFDFPLGTMFWMRRAALQPLLDLHLDWDDYPAEPLPYDGSILHAIERLMPMVCQLAGFTSAVTHVFGVTW
jgi:lipopolysaccharide biosynthesis protein